MNLKIKKVILPIIITLFAFSLFTPSEVYAGKCILIGSDDKGECYRFCVQPSYSEDSNGECVDTAYKYESTNTCPRRCSQYSPVSAGGLLPVPGSSCNSITDTDDNIKCKSSICPSTCNKSGLTSVCTSENDIIHTYCNYGVCTADKTLSADNPQLFSPGAIPCNYTLEDLIQTGINFANILFGVAGGLMLLFIIYGGWQMLTSIGKTEEIENARKTLTAAFIGIILVIAATLIIRFIGVLLGGDFGGGANLGKTGFCVRGNVCPEGTEVGDQSPDITTCVSGQTYCVPK